MKLKFPNDDHGEVVIESGTLSLGAAAGNDVVLESEGVAESHARISSEADGYYIRPVEEADVYVNGRRIQERTRVSGGDVLGIHKVQVRLERTEGDSRQPAAQAEQKPTPEATKVRPAVTDWQLRGVSGESFGRVVPLRGRMTIGRGEGCDIVLEATEVSRQHAAIEVTREGVVIEDVDSSNGTFVNGERITRKEVEQGDEIAFDKVRFRVEMATRPETVRRPPPSRPSPPKPQPAPSGGGKGIWIGLGVVVVLAAAALAAWYLELIRL